MLATLSAHGRLLDGEKLSSSSREASDLATLIGRSFVEMYNQSRRRPIRAYRRLPHTGFSIEGDFAPEELCVPGEDGFDQEVTTFTSRKSYNAVMRAAASKLATIVSDMETRARLENVARTLPWQAAPTRLIDRRLPSQARCWQSAYDLAVDILRGFGGTFDPKHLSAPGYVVKTWQVWEDVVSLGLRLGFGAKRLAVKRRFQLGSRRIAGKGSPVNVIPDCVLSIDGELGRRAVVVDAKYKGNVNRGERTVSSSDLYEALAFSRGTKVNDVVLLYPMTIGTGPEPRGAVGAVRDLGTVLVDDTRVRAIEIGVRGISEAGGLRRFASVLKSAIYSGLT